MGAAGRLTKAALPRATLPVGHRRGVLHAFVSHCIVDPGVDGMLISGGTGITAHDCAPEALLPLIEDSPVESLRRDQAGAGPPRALLDDIFEQIIIEGGEAVGRAASMPAHPDLAAQKPLVTELRRYIRNLAQ